MTTIFDQYPELQELFVIYCLLHGKEVVEVLKRPDRVAWMDWQIAEYKAYIESKKLSQEAPESMSHPFFISYVKEKYRSSWQGFTPEKEF